MNARAPWPRSRAGLAIFSTLAAASLFVGASSVAWAETDQAFILNSFPQCKSAPVFSPYSSGAVGEVEARERAEWFSHLKPIRGAPCVLPSDDGVIFCDKLVCRNIATDPLSITPQNGQGSDGK